MAFEYKRSRKEQNLQAGEPVDNDISFSGRPRDFSNMFASRMQDTNIDYSRTSADSFSNEKADDFVKTSQVLTDGIPDFVDPNQQLRASDFLEKYARTALIAEEEKANSQNALGYIQQDPKSNLANDVGYAGSEGVGIS